MLSEIALASYVAGVVIGMLVMRDPWPVRLGTAAVWPVGIASFAVVTVTLAAAALYLWPVLLLAFIPAIAVLWLLF
jgi:hypothetical protein